MFFKLFKNFGKICYRLSRLENYQYIEAYQYIIHVKTKVIKKKNNKKKLICLLVQKFI